MSFVDLEAEQENLFAFSKAPHLCCSDSIASCKGPHMAMR